jgi:predicted NBD/HSP70 family sugar kinase
MVQAEQVIAAAATDPGCAQALAHAAQALGRGIGALVNAQDPEAVGLSGLAADMYQADPDAVTVGYLSGLMRFRRADPPALLPSTLGDLGSLTGASELVFDAFLTPRGLGAWRSPGQKTA